jgi:hypothetical protein
MNAHALVVLEAAQSEAQDGPIKATPAVRLALGWLVLSGVAERWQVSSFCNALPKPPTQPDPHVRWTFDYCRQRDMEIFLGRWRINARERRPGEKTS